jgi:hypothetical protein
MKTVTLVISLLLGLVAPVWAQVIPPGFNGKGEVPVLLGTLEQPIRLCSTETVAVKVELLFGAEAGIDFLDLDQDVRRESLRFRVGGGPWGDGQQALTPETWVELPPLLSPGLNRLHIWAVPYRDSLTTEALTIWLRRGEHAHLLRLLYRVNDLPTYPLRTDVFVSLDACANP